ncbi:MAG: 50S ribosomal protein L28 [Atopobiaceae bacterium]|nr:50S ribosomal protein L28 [Atopobiaceae bacterium]
MSKVCAICGKHAVAGRSISHSHRVSNRKFKPNIQHVHVVIDGHRKPVFRIYHHESLETQTYMLIRNQLASWFFCISCGA